MMLVMMMLIMVMAIVMMVTMLMMMMKEVKMWKSWRALPRSLVASKCSPIVATVWQWRWSWWGTWWWWWWLGHCRWLVIMALRIMRQWWGAPGNFDDMIQENIDDNKDWNYMLTNVMIYMTTIMTMMMMWRTMLRLSQVVCGKLVHLSKITPSFTCELPNNN